MYSFNKLDIKHRKIKRRPFLTAVTVYLPFGLVKSYRKRKVAESNIRLGKFVYSDLDHFEDRFGISIILFLHKAPRHQRPHFDKRNDPGSEDNGRLVNSPTCAHH